MYRKEVTDRMVLHGCCKPV